MTVNTWTDRIYTANAGGSTTAGTVSVISGGTNKVLATVAYVVNQDDATLSVLVPAS